MLLGFGPIIFPLLGSTTSPFSSIIRCSEPPALTGPEPTAAAMSGVVYWYKLTSGVHTTFCPVGDTPLRFRCAGELSPGGDLNMFGNCWFISWNTFDMTE